ncbi:MAG: hypothetical protein IPK85_06945 [Gemmatimonadetes bacterium]|nr:hypothetical protein [Gemmatimonadota bacterium]
MSSPRFPDATADRLLRRAIELAEELGSSTTLADLRDSAQQVGVDPEFVDRAFVEIMERREDHASLHEGKDKAPTAWWHLDGRERTWLSRLARYGVLALCLYPTVSISTKLANRLPFDYWHYQGVVEGVFFGAVYLLVGRLVKVPLAQVVGGFVLLVHLAVAAAAAANTQPYWLPGNAANAAGTAAVLASAATALWFRWRSRNERRGGSEG